MFSDNYLLSKGFSLVGKSVVEVGKAEANSPFLEVTQDQQGLGKKKKQITSMCNHHAETPSDLGK